MGIRHNLLTVMVVCCEIKESKYFEYKYTINDMMAKLHVRCLNTVQPNGSRKSSPLQFVHCF